MALHADLEALLGAMAPEDAEAQRKLFEKTPALAEGYLRQADYDRKMNTSKEEIKAAAERAKVWEDWGRKNEPIHEQLLKDYKEIEQKNRDLETQIKIAAAGGDMTPEQAAQLQLDILKQIAEQGYIKQDQAAALAKTEAVTAAVAEVKKIGDEFLGRTWPAAMETQAGLIEVTFNHQQEFGKPLTRDDRVKIGKLMEEKQIGDIFEAYNQYVAADREKIKIDTEAQKRVDEDRKKREPAQQIPGVSTVGQEVGHMQLTMADRMKATTGNTGGEIGDNSAASAAAAELRAEGRV